MVRHQTFFTRCPVVAGGTTLIRRALCDGVTGPYDEITDFGSSAGLRWSRGVRAALCDAARSCSRSGDQCAGDARCRASGRAPSLPARTQDRKGQTRSRRARQERHLPARRRARRHRRGYLPPACPPVRRATQAALTRLGEYAASAQIRAPALRNSGAGQRSGSHRFRLHWQFRRNAGGDLRGGGFGSGICDILVKAGPNSPVRSGPAVAI